ncbi:MAG: hypothetical protein ACI4LO_01065 [Anaerovoracaceae bacterium]
MKSKASYFNISSALVIENIRRFWAVSAIGFLMYFLSGPLPVLMSYTHINDMYDFLDNCFSNIQPVFLVAHLSVPVIAAVILFRYLQNSASVTSMHSMPFTRTQLFNSTLASGIILILMPLLLNGIIFHIMAKPAYATYMYSDYPAMTVLNKDAVNIFSHGNINMWLLQSSILLLSVFAVSVFAGMLTGNIFMHIAMALGLNFLIPALYLSVTVYCNEFFYGFTTTGVHEELLMASSPFTELFVCEGKYPMTFFIIYTVSIVLLFVLSWYLYQKRALEKAGDSLVFRFIIPVICYLIAYFGMTVFGFYFKNEGFISSETDSSMLYFCIGSAAGAVLTFIVGRMIVLNTPRIFNMASLKSFVVYGVLASLFLCSFIYDWTGFEKRVPAEADIEKVAISAFESLANDDRYSSYYFKPLDKEAESKYFPGDFYFTSPENIKLVKELHKEITGMEDEYSEASFNSNKRYSSMMIDYALRGNPFGLHRSYTIPYNSLLENRYMKALYESKEFKDFYSLDRIKADKILNVVLSNPYYDLEELNTSITLTSEDEIKELFAVMEEDFRNRTYEEMTDLRHSYCDISIYYEYKEEGSDIPAKDSMYFGILRSDTATIEWLDSRGYSPVFECSADDVAKIAFCKYDDSDETYYEEPAYEEDVIYDDSVNEEGMKQLVITDKQKISEILSTCNAVQTDYGKYYEGTIYLSINTAQGTTMTVTTIVYYQPENVPSYIKEYFE